MEEERKKWEERREKKVKERKWGCQRRMREVKKVIWKYGGRRKRRGNEWIYLRRMKEEKKNGFYRLIKMVEGREC